MSEKILVPVLGESITEATVAKWLKNPGDAVELDEPIVELETDKVNLEVPSPISGVLTEINSKDGSVVEVGALLGSVSEEGEGIKVSPSQKDEVAPKENNIIKLDASKKEPKINKKNPFLFKIWIVHNFITKLRLTLQYPIQDTFRNFLCLFPRYPTINTSICQVEYTCSFWYVTNGNHPNPFTYFGKGWFCPNLILRIKYLIYRTRK